MYILYSAKIYSLNVSIKFCMSNTVTTPSVQHPTRHLPPLPLLQSISRGWFVFEIKLKSFWGNTGNGLMVEWVYPCIVVYLLSKCIYSVPCEARARSNTNLESFFVGSLTNKFVRGHVYPHVTVSMCAPNHLASLMNIPNEFRAHIINIIQDCLK